MSVGQCVSQSTCEAGKTVSSRTVEDKSDDKLETKESVRSMAAIYMGGGG